MSAPSSLLTGDKVDTRIISRLRVTGRCVNDNLKEHLNREDTYYDKFGCCDTFQFDLFTSSKKLQIRYVT